MENKERGVQNSPVLGKVLVLLGDLKVSPAGAIIHGHIEHMLSDVLADHQKTEQAYARFLDMLIEACISLIPVDSPLHTHLRLVQLRLTPPLSVSELSMLNRAIEAAADELTQTNSLQGSDLAPLLSPLIERFGGPVQPTTASVVNTPRTTPLTTPLTTETTAKSAAKGERAVDQPSSSAKSESVADFHVNVAYRAHLDEKREEMQKLQQDFIAQMGEAVAESENFDQLLQDAVAALQQAETIDSLETRKRELMRALEGLTEGNQSLGEKFSRAQEYLTIIEDDNQQLSEELDRVRLLSLTDELTRLPNRRAFMRRLEDEVSRVQRHGYPLSLVVMDLDHFKRINDLRGHAAGDTVLRSYSKEVLSIFRHHDLVARYGGEEFAVLMPNTDVDGVVCALKKVRRRLEEVTKAHGPEDVALPTFSAGVAQFHPGEMPHSFIERADAALYAAKRNGRDRTEINGDEQRMEAPAPSSGA